MIVSAAMKFHVHALTITFALLSSVSFADTYTVSTSLTQFPVPFGGPVLLDSCSQSGSANVSCPVFFPPCGLDEFSECAESMAGTGQFDNPPFLFLAYANAEAREETYLPQFGLSFIESADASFSVDFTTQGTGFFQPSYFLAGDRGTLSGPFGIVPFTDGQTFTVTGSAGEGISEDSLRQSFVGLTSIQVFDPAMNPLGIITSGQLIQGATPEPSTFLLLLSGIAVVCFRRVR